MTYDKYEDLGCDGTNTFFLLHELRPDLKAMYGQIIKDCFPTPRDYPVTQPWFAYLSQDYAKTNRHFKALWAAPPPLCYLYVADISFCESYPHLPRKASWRIDPNQVEKAKEILKEHYPSGVPQIALSSLYSMKIDIESGRLPKYTYNVIQYTNFNGMYLPLEYCLTIHDFRFNPKTTREDLSKNIFERAARIKPDYVKVAEFIGISKIIENNQLTYPYPDLPQDVRISVWDGRFKNTQYKLPGINYMLTNQWILNCDSSKLRQLYQTALKRKKAYEFSFLKALYCGAIIGIPMLVVALCVRKRKED